MSRNEVRGSELDSNRFGVKALQGILDMICLDRMLLRVFCSLPTR